MKKVLHTINNSVISCIINDYTRPDLSFNRSAIQQETASIEHGVKAQEAKVSLTKINRS